MPRSKRLYVYSDHNGIYASMVAAPNIKEAAKLMNTTVYGIRTYGYRVCDKQDIALAVSMPGRVWKKPLGSVNKEPWKLVDNA